jgi:hypothetical protein
MDYPRAGIFNCNSDPEVPPKNRTNTIQLQDHALTPLCAACQRGGAAMRDFLRTNHPTFDPKAVQLMADAFEAAWPIIRPKAKFD